MNLAIGKEQQEGTENKTGTEGREGTVGRKIKLAEPSGRNSRSEPKICLAKGKEQKEGTRNKTGDRQGTVSRNR